MQDDIHKEPISGNEDSYARLVTIIEASKGILSLLIASCDDRNFRDSIIRRYEAELSPQIPGYRVQLNYEEPSLLSALRQLQQANPELKKGKAAVLTVTGTEDLLTVALGEDTIRTEVQRFFGYLQWTREALRQFPYPIVLWVTPKILEQISFAAPDFWSWRSGVFRFVATEVVKETVTPTIQTNELYLIDSEVIEPLPLDELLLRVNQVKQEQGEQSLALAILYDRLGQAYRSLVKNQQAEHLQQDIDLGLEYFQKATALQILLKDKPNLANTLNRLGNFYQELGRYKRAISLYKQSLAISREIGAQQTEAASLSNLGKAYQFLGYKASNLETAIAAYNNALQIYTREAFPEDWARIQNNLANAYRNRIRGQKAQNLETAIAAYNNALQIYTREAFPVDWAMTQNNLAIAYRNRIRGQKAQNLETAIAAYKNALQIRTREAFPEKWAMTQNNLAAAYSDRIRGDKAQNLEHAIASYQNALQIYTREAFPFEWATTQNNLASAYLYRIRGERADNL
ncbi:MAG: tetratricopeptide repeat protein, partial [Symploca sp. SIO2G7]|nr:tetratricopeptide repeat protein [Symploca sp. SIO2G7]